jgi:hypothetical protein
MAAYIPRKRRTLPSLRNQKQPYKEEKELALPTIEPKEARVEAHLER